PVLPGLAGAAPVAADHAALGGLYLGGVAADALELPEGGDVDLAGQVEDTLRGRQHAVAPAPWRRGTLAPRIAGDRLGVGARGVEDRVEPQPEEALQRRGGDEGGQLLAVVAGGEGPEDLGDSGVVTPQEIAHHELGPSAVARLGGEGDAQIGPLVGD